MTTGLWTLLQGIFWGKTVEKDARFCKIIAVISLYIGTGMPVTCCLPDRWWLPPAKASGLLFSSTRREDAISMTCSHAHITRRRRFRCCRCCDQSAIKTICNHFLLTDRPRRQISLPSGRFRSRLADGSLTWCISAVNFAGRFLMTNLLTAVHFCQSKFMSGIVVALRMRCCDLFWLACYCDLTPSIGDRA